MADINLLLYRSYILSVTMCRLCTLSYSKNTIHTLAFWKLKVAGKMTNVIFGPRRVDCNLQRIRLSQPCSMKIISQANRAKYNYYRKSQYYQTFVTRYRQRKLLLFYRAVLQMYIRNGKLRFPLSNVVCC